MRILALTMTMAFLGLASLASADEVTRESYVASVEPICKSNTLTTERILKHTRAQVRQGKLKPAGVSFIKASKAFSRTYNQLKAVPQPEADKATLAKWLHYVKEGPVLFMKTGKALKANNKHLAQKMLGKITHNANQANNAAFAFNFRYCHFNTSKFT